VASPARALASSRSSASLLAKDCTAPPAEHPLPYPYNVRGGSNCCRLAALTGQPDEAHVPRRRNPNVVRAYPPLVGKAASRRRVKVIGRLPGEHSCLSLVWAVLDRASVGWRGIDTSVAGIRRLQDLRRQLLW
jgi:hypothetical protein